ncbi:unnamed protein product [Timema podura]|uniref:Uncharacterized protein n=1 Tax=Timema podura TaxID=61482 RepID=A0ABN7NWV0_TIMPD|nr:unnamed protein product [Timema podura]
MVMTPTGSLRRDRITSPRHTGLFVSPHSPPPHPVTLSFPSSSTFGHFLANSSTPLYFFPPPAPLPNITMPVLKLRNLKHIARILGSPSAHSFRLSHYCSPLVAIFNLGWAHLSGAGGCESSEHGGGTVLDGASALHQALAGETFSEKERRLSEMILQLQMVREQLVSQQEQQSKAVRLHPPMALLLDKMMSKLLRVIGTNIQQLAHEVSHLRKTMGKSLRAMRP